MLAPLTHVLLSAIDCLEFLRVFCNRASSFFICNSQCPTAPFALCQPLDTPTPDQYRHLVVKSGTTAGQHDMSSAWRSGLHFVRCTPPHHPLCPSIPPGRGIWWHWSELMFYCLQCSIDCLEFSRVLWNRPCWLFRCHPLTPLCTSLAPMMAP